VRGGGYDEHEGSLLLMIGCEVTSESGPGGGGGDGLELQVAITVL
jgi:hypothetical protein